MPPKTDTVVSIHSNKFDKQMAKYFATPLILLFVTELAYMKYNSQVRLGRIWMVTGYWLIHTQ